MSGSRAQQQALGIPAGFKIFSAFPFAGMNQSASRIAMDDKESFWLENFIRIGDGNLRTLWDVDIPFYTVPAGKKMVYFFWYNIGHNIYVAIFLNDGTAVQVQSSVGEPVRPIGSPVTISSALNTFFVNSNGQLPDCVQSGTQYLLICNHNTSNDYWIWDGSLLYGAGSIAPIVASDITDGGTGYTTTPTTTVYGGSGSGVVLTALINEGSVISLTVNDAGSGYLPGEFVQVAFSGGGSDNSAILQAVLSTNNIDHITLVSGGSSYNPGTYALGFTGGGGGSGAAGTFTVVGSVVTSINLTSGGSGYVSTPTVTFPGAGGSGALAVVTLGSGAISSVTVVDGGTGFQGTPTLTVVGGGGTGAVLTAVLTGQSISSVTVTNGGSNFSSTPAIEVQTGVNHAAAAILQLMPFGVSGTAIETYQQRVWISYPKPVGSVNNGGTFQVSAPGSLTDFATSDGGDIFTNTDRFLRQQYTFLRQTSNFLYATGDSSVTVISNVQTAGNPPTTTFSYQNTDPQTGSSWRDTAQDYANTILFANAFGVFGIYGGSVRKVSGPVDKIFTNAIFPPEAGALTPSAGVANLYSQKVYTLLMTVRDPFTNKPRNVLMLWDQARWYVASQSPALNFIGAREVNSDIDTWGTDGTSLYYLFSRPSATLPKVVATKQYGGAQSFLINMLHSIYIDAEDVSTAQAGITFAPCSVNAVGLAVPAYNSVTNLLVSVPSINVSFPQPLTFQAPQGLGAMYGFGAGAGMPQVPGVALGLTLSTNSPDMVLRNISLGYLEYSAVA